MASKNVTIAEIYELCQKAGISPDDLQLQAHEEPYTRAEVAKAIKDTLAWQKANPGETAPKTDSGPALSAEPKAPQPALFARIRDNVPREVMTAFSHDQEFIKGEFRRVDPGHEAEAQAHPDLETVTK
jgi:hypothetical protein